MENSAKSGRGAFPLPRRPGFGIELNTDAITSRGPWDGRLS
jgi:hypothetical protein